MKGQVSGNEDLYIDGTVEGLVQLDERKVTVGATARLTADITAREVAWQYCVAIKGSPPS